MNKNQRLNLIACATATDSNIVDIGNNVYNLTLSEIPYGTLFYDPVDSLKITPIKDGMLIYQNGHRNVVTIQRVKELALNKSGKNTMVTSFSVDFTYNDLNVSGITVSPILKDIITYKDTLGLLLTYVDDTMIESVLNKYREFQYSNKTYHTIKVENVSILVKETSSKLISLPYVTVIFCTCKDVKSDDELQVIKNTVVSMYN